MSRHEQIAALLAKGDVFYNLRGKNKDEVLATLVRILKVPKSVDKKGLAEALIERENLASTGMGEGFALPHPRNPMIKNEADALVAIGYLDTPIDWESPDGKPVSIVFLVLSSGVEQHLGTISALACITQSENFKTLIARHPPKTELLELIPRLADECGLA